VVDATFLRARHDVGRPDCRIDEPSALDFSVRLWLSSSSLEPGLYHQRPDVQGLFRLRRRVYFGRHPHGGRGLAQAISRVPPGVCSHPKSRFTPARRRATTGVFPSARGDAIYAAPWLRSGECVRESRRTTGRLLRACAPSRRPSQNAFG